ncbi:MAG TPA: ATP-binding protein [Candidatus Chromulinivoraceae bacterium]|nr:ATP-binding protein [Candidatus Chromulinivoraceae bacterium]
MSSNAVGVYKKLSIGAKLTLALLFFGSITGVAIVYFQIQSVNTIESSFASLISHDFAQIGALDQIKVSLLEIEGTALRKQQTTLPEINNSLQTIQNQIKASGKTYQDNLDSSDKAQGALSIAIISGYVNRLVTDALALHSTGNQLSAAQYKTQEDQLLSDVDTASQTVSDIGTSARQRVDINNSVINTFASNELHTTVIATIIAVVFLVVAGSLIANRLGRSIAKLKVGAQRVANGDFSEMVQVTSHDEIGQLAATFNQMSTRLRESYRRLAVEKQRDEAIMQSMGEGLIAIDEKGAIVLINQVAASFIGVEDKAAAVGQSITDVFKLYSQDDKSDMPIAESERPSTKALASGESIEELLVIHGVDTKKHLMNVGAYPIELDDKVIGAIVMLRDVTKEKEVDRMKTEFISLASHQLRTPLSAIKWFTEMLIAGDAGELKADQMEFAKNISDSTERMIALVNALLNISRMESGRIMVDPKPTDLRELVTGITNDLKAKIEEKQQTLIISIHEELPKINLDPRLIGQVYLNLLTNALKYTQKGGEISVFISKKDDQVVSQVTDNGYGIPKDQQGRLFQKFFRASNAVKVETDGTGLGLYLIKSIVESSGGKIWFESEEGKGTSFWFSMPLSGMKAKEGEVTLDN